MQALAWLLCIALALAMPSSTVPRMTQNSQRGLNGLNEEDDAENSPLQLRTRPITGAKTYSLKKSIDAVKDSGHAAIHDPVIGRPIWREIRESVLNSLQSPTVVTCPRSLMVMMKVKTQDPGGTVKARENNKKQNRAEVENSFLKRKQRARSKVDGKKQRQKIYLEEIPDPTSSWRSTCAYMCVLTGEQRALVFGWVACCLCLKQLMHLL
jgi:hypothetical protein